MQHSRFLVLTGHLNDYPLSDLVGILRHQKKTGRMLIEYPDSPASFFFNEGELVDIQLGNLSGLQALCVALAQPPSSFNFNPLIRPTRRSIENSFQKVVSELLGCWGENELEVEQIATSGTLPQPALPASTSAPLADGRPMGIDKPSTFLALPPGPVNRFSRPILAMAAAGLLLLGLSTVIAVTGAFGKRDSSSDAPSPSRQAGEQTSVPKTTEAQSEILSKTEFSNNLRVQRTIAKGKDAQLAPEPSNRQESRNLSVSKKEMEGSKQNGEMLSTTKPDTKAGDEQSNAANAEPQLVNVVLKIEGGRVSQASIANHRSGMEAYEALALRIARQRRFPSKGTTQEMVTIKLSPPK